MSNENLYHNPERAEVPDNHQAHDAAPFNLAKTHMSDADKPEPDDGPPRPWTSWDAGVKYLEAQTAGKNPEELAALRVVNEAEIARLPPASLESQVRRAWDESLRLQEHNHRMWESKAAFSEQMRPTFPEGLGGSPDPDIEFAHIIEREFPEGPEGSLDPEVEFRNIIEREFSEESSE